MLAAPAVNPEWKPSPDVAADLQGLAISAYPDQLFAMLIMVKYPSGPSGRPSGRPNAWVAQVASRITNATDVQDLCLNLAFSAAGYASLGSVRTSCLRSRGLFERG